MRRLLLAIDGSDSSNRAAAHAASLAQAIGNLQIIVLNVQPSLIEWETRGFATEAILKHRGQLAEDAVTQAREILNHMKIAHEFLYRMSDDPATEIVTIANDRQCDAIVMGTRGLGRVETLVLGSVTTKVIHLSSVPVTVVK